MAKVTTAIEQLEGQGLVRVLGGTKMISSWGGEIKGEMVRLKP